MARTKKKVVGMLGNGEIGKSMSRICNEAGCRVLVREIDFDEIKDQKIDYLHVNIPESRPARFIEVVVNTIKELKPKLTVINSTVTVGVTRKIFDITKLPIVHSPVIGIHPHLYKSIKHYFKKIVGPVNEEALDLVKSHFRDLGLKIEVYDTSEDSEAAKLLDLVYYAWNIIFCKWVKEVCDQMNLNFDQVYTRHNDIYNKGYAKLRPNVVRPILIPYKGPIGGHCTIPDTLMFDKKFRTRFTKFILKENEKYKKAS